MSEFASENIRRFVSRRYLLALVALIVALGLGYGVYYFAYWRQSPRYALWQIVRAIQANDTKTLFSYIDLQAVTDNLAEKSTGELEAWLLQKGLGATPGDDDMSRLARSLTRKFARFLVPKVVAVLEPQIRVAVEKYLAELNAMEKAALSAIPAQAEIQEQDGMAQVTLTDPNSGKQFQFRMARPPQSNHWRIVEINYQDLLTVLGKKLQD